MTAAFGAFEGKSKENRGRPSWDTEGPALEVKLHSFKLALGLTMAKSKCARAP